MSSFSCSLEVKSVSIAAKLSVLSVLSHQLMVSASISAHRFRGQRSRQSAGFSLWLVCVKCYIEHEACLYDKRNFRKLYTSIYSISIIYEYINFIYTFSLPYRTTYT